MLSKLITLVVVLVNYYNVPTYLITLVGNYHYVPTYPIVNATGINMCHCSEGYILFSTGGSLITKT